MDLFKPIPQIKMPSIYDYNINYLDEEIISLSEAGFKCESQYSIAGIPGAYKDCYARKTVVEKLLYAQSLLPKGLKFKIYDYEKDESEFKKYLEVTIRNVFIDYKRKLKKKEALFSDENIIVDIVDKK